MKGDRKGRTQKTVDASASASGNAPHENVPSHDPGSQYFKCICGTTLKNSVRDSDTTHGKLRHIMGWSHRSSTGLKLLEVMCESCECTFSPRQYLSHLRGGKCGYLKSTLKWLTDHTLSHLASEFAYAEGKISWEELPLDIRDPDWKRRSEQTADCVAAPSSSSTVEPHVMSHYTNALIAELEGGRVGDPDYCYGCLESEHEPMYSLDEYEECFAHNRCG